MDGNPSLKKQDYKKFSLRGKKMRSYWNVYVSATMRHCKSRWLESSGNTPGAWSLWPGASSLDSVIKVTGVNNLPREKKMTTGRALRNVNISG